MMKRKHTQTILAIFMLMNIIMLFFAAPKSVQAQAGAPWEVLAEINAYRAANGLGPLAENQYLNIAAQNHVNWMVETGQYTHTGANGSTATDRALAVGYGEGSYARVTENWARGYDLSASGAVYDLWMPSAIHNSQMLTTSYNEFGAGVALSPEGMTVYVVKFGLVVGSAPGPTTEQTPAPNSPAITPEPFIQAVVTAEPNPDGSVVHIVQYGHTLWSIADAYKINMPDLLTQNGITEEYPIFPEQELVIKAAAIEEQDTEEPADPTPTEEKPSPTPRRTSVNASKPTQITPTPTEEIKAASSFLIHFFSGDTLLAGVGLVVVSVFGIALLFFTSSKLK